MDVPFIKEEMVLTGVSDYAVDTLPDAYCISADGVQFDVTRQEMQLWTERCHAIGIAAPVYNGRVVGLNGHKIHSVLARKLCRVMQNFAEIERVRNECL
jgi:hypothetical protein